MKKDYIVVAIKITALTFGVLFMAFILLYSHFLFSSDTLASDIIVQEIMSHKTLAISDYWSQQTFFQFNILFWLPKLLLWLIIPNIIVVDKICVALLYLLFLFLVYLVSKSFLKNESAWIVVGVLGCGISYGWMVNAVVEIAYTIYLIYMLAFLGLSNYIFENLEQKRNRKQNIVLIILALLVIYVLAIDQRYVVVFIIPYCIAIALVYYIDNYKVNALKDLGKISLLNFGILFCVMGTSALVGLFINSYLKKSLPFSPRLTGVMNYQFAEPQDFFKSLAIHIAGILQLWGCDLNTSVSTLSFESIGYLIKGILCITCMVIIPVLCAIKYKKMPRGIKVLLLFYIIMVSILFYIYVFSVLGTTANNRYFTYEIILAIQISSWYLYENMIKPHNLNRFLFIVALVCFGVISQLTTFTIVMKNNGFKEQYEAREFLIEALKECDLSYGYATYWNAQIITSMSNAQIKVLPVNIMESAVISFYDMNYNHQFSADNYKGKSFIVFTNQEYEEFSERLEQIYIEGARPEEIVNINNYVILLYDYNIAEKFMDFSYNVDYLPFADCYSIEQTICKGNYIEFDNL